MSGISAALLLRREEHTLFEWEHRLPLVRRDRPTRLSHQTGGTRLHLTVLHRRLVVPLPGFIFTIEVTAYAHGISRALRS